MAVLYSVLGQFGIAHWSCDPSRATCLALTLGLGSLAATFGGGTSVSLSVTLYAASAVALIVLVLSCFESSPTIARTFAFFGIEPRRPRLSVDKCDVELCSLLLRIPRMLQLPHPVAGFQTIYGPAVITQGKGWIGHVSLKNDRDAVKVSAAIAEVSYSDSKGHSIIIPKARWSWESQPRAGGKPESLRSEEEVRFRGPRPRQLELVINGDEKGVCYALDDSSLEHPGWRRPEYRLEGEVLITVKLYLNDDAEQTMQFGIRHSKSRSTSGISDPRPFILFDESNDGALT